MKIKFVTSHQYDKEIKALESKGYKEHMILDTKLGVGIHVEALLETGMVIILLQHINEYMTSKFDVIISVSVPHENLFKI